MPGRLRTLPTRPAIAGGPDLAVGCCQLAVPRVAEINSYDIRGECGAVCRGLDLRPVRTQVGRVIDTPVLPLVLVNNSKQPLLLLAGEIVAGGKQDRVIGQDRIVPAESDPIDLNVFCVEPGRWTATSAKFGSMESAMAQPAVRAKAMGAKDQGQVWEQVRKQQASIAANLEASEAVTVNGTTSYARVMDNAAVKEQVDSIAEPMQRSYLSLIHELRQECRGRGGRGEWPDYLCRHFCQHQFAGKILAEAGAFLCGGSHCDPNRQPRY
jgi:hypothetical protein